MSARTLLASKSNCGAARASIVFSDFSQTRQAATNKIGGETAVHPCASAIASRGANAFWQKRSVNAVTAW
jgi:hypothetical protein